MMDLSWSFSAARSGNARRKHNPGPALAYPSDEGEVMIIGRNDGMEEEEEEVGTPSPPPVEEAGNPDHYNTLNPKERGFLVRKNRKLAQILGEDPIISPYSPVPDGIAQLESIPIDRLVVPTDSDLKGDAASFLSLPPSPVSPSFETDAEIDRKRKRARLAKLHRYLGGDVPAEKVLGITEYMRDLDLPSTEASGPAQEERAWRNLTWRRKSMVATFPNWEEEIGESMHKDELSEREKATNVKRAYKMEKLFGDRPPQELFHTRSPPLETIDSPRIGSASTSFITSMPRIRPPTLIKRRPSAASTDSSKHLLRASGDSDTYRRYRDSLNSLSEIVGRDDKRSLAAIHQLLRTSDEWDSASEEQSESSKAERRRSLPITKKDSLLSLRSVAALSPEQTEFQLRRKRAAKLAGFFGVDYNRLFEDVLAAFELGVVEESGRGSLRPHETEVLLDKLRRLKAQNAL